jgi:RimJ/RimL family protein N-acetyltransferase
MTTLKAPPNQAPPSAHHEHGSGLIFETRRLLLAPVSAADAPSLHAIWTKPEVREFLWDDRTLDPRETADIVQRNETLIRDRRIGLWAVRVKGGSDMIGIAGISPVGAEQVIELVFALDPAWWSRGIAREASEPVLEYAFHTLGWPEVLASSDRGNERSHALLRRLGFRALRDQGNDPLVRYRLVRERVG